MNLELSNHRRAFTSKYGKTQATHKVESLLVYVAHKVPQRHLLHVWIYS
jgi:hypothetical protein